MFYNIVTQFNAIISVGAKISMKKFPSKLIGTMDIHYIRYVIAIGKLVYTLVCTRLDIVHVG